ncbi:MAG: hypothetical protein HC945_03535 [Nitrosarchaeum sp.]|nr:hypothetical protein [Nitrosarchaeum sp.]
MRLTIDTTHDSPEEIRKAITLLTALIGQQTPPQEAEQPMNTPEAFLSLFGEENSSPTPTNTQTDENEEDNPQDEEEPRIEFY